MIEMLIGVRLGMELNSMQLKHYRAPIAPQV